MKQLLLILFFFISFSVYAQDLAISGHVTDAASKEPLTGVSISIKGKAAGAVTDNKGFFSLKLGKSRLPVTLIFSSVGHENREVTVSAAGQVPEVSLNVKTNTLDEVVFAASRVNENILRSPVSIEKMNQKAIKENPSLTFYDGLQSLKGMEVVTSSITYKQVNTRGFNSTGNARFLQLVDGVDNQTPGLNFAVGNQFGASDLDIESAELIPGAASALYGPVAFNGMLMMHTKDPFKYQGLMVQAKTGVNHLGSNDPKPQGLYDFALRYAKAFNNRFAFKINASYLSGLDWYADNYEDVSAATPPALRGPNNPARDALNIYGDEVSRTLPGIGLVSRTGYEEKDLMNYNVYSFKSNIALHYRINDKLEAIYQYNYGRGTASYTGSSRFDLNNFVLQTHRIELRSPRFFVRSYVVQETSNDSYNTRSLGQFINRTWVRNLSNTDVVSQGEADNTWFARYAAAFTGTVAGVSGNNHTGARWYADQGRALPGSPKFEQAKNTLIHNYGLQGAGVMSNSKFSHTEGQYDISNVVKAFDLLAGGSFRYYDMFTNGSLFDDKTNKVTIKEYGGFIQAGKRLLDDKLKLNASIRYDKNENFNGSFTPRFSAVYTLAGNHNFRASYQTGFRNPTPVDQFIKLNVGPITILGGAPSNSKGMNVYENSFTAASVSVFGAAFGAAMAGGAGFPAAVNNNKNLLKKSDVAYIKPEQQKAFEIGYKGMINNNLMVDLNYYYSSYTNFILSTVVIRPESQILAPDGSISFAAASDIPNNKISAFQLYTNASDKVSSQGLGFGLTHMMQKGYTLGGNLTWASFNLRNANPSNVPAFNTPEWSTNLTFGNSNVGNGFGFNIAWHWQDAFDWYGTFNGTRPGRIDAYSLIDLQVNKKIPNLHSTIKLGASNLLNHQVYTAYGSPTIGGIYYISVTFDSLLK
jgi:iron complex outermembrane receptor protein